MKQHFAARLCLVFASLWLFFSCGQQDPSFVENLDQPVESQDANPNPDPSNAEDMIENGIDFGKMGDGGDGGDGNSNNSGSDVSANTNGGGGNNGGGNNGGNGGGNGGGNNSGGQGDGGTGGGDDPSPIIIDSIPITEFAFSLIKPNQLTVNATVRDFNDDHEDFEYGTHGHVPGLVKSMIGPNRKPVLSDSHTPRLGDILDADSFSDWYQDRSFNKKMNLPLVLTQNAAGNYSYVNDNFFPIDGKLFGNQGRIHNYHFTLEIHSQFVYRGGETFEFIGDDDVWVFINNKLVVDLGGVHGQISGSVNVDTLGLEIGKAYNFDMFFAERHTTKSHFKIETSLGLIQNQYQYQIEASEIDSNPLTYSLEQAPAGAKVSDKGLVTWAVKETDIGKTFAFKVKMHAPATGAVHYHSWNLVVK